MSNPSPSKVVVTDVRFSYLNVFEKNRNDKFSVSLIIKKDNKKDVKAINAAIDYVIADVKSKNNGKLPPNFKLPLRDGDVERPDDPAYANAYFVNANSSQQPGIVDRQRQPIIDKDKFYSGCHGAAEINFYAFNFEGKKGIACGLNHLMKTRDGDALSGRGSAEDAFSDLVFEDDLLA